MSRAEVDLAEEHALGLSVARNPDATEEELAETAERFLEGGFFDSDRTPFRYYLAAQAVAAHPNTPLQALIDLAGFFPLEVSSNPALGVQLAISGVTEEHERTLRLFAIAPTRNISAGLLRFLEQHWYASAHSSYGALALAQHPHVNPRLLVHAAHNAQGNHHAAFANHESFPDEHDHRPYKVGELFNPLAVATRYYSDAVAYLAYRRLIAPEVAFDFAISMSGGSTHDVTAMIVDAYHPETPERERENRIHSLMEHGVKYFPPESTPPDWGLEAVPADDAAVLCLKFMPYITVMVALTPDLPELVMRHLLWENDPRVRGALALNPTAPKWAIAALLSDTNSRVRATAKQHPHAQTSNKEGTACTTH